MGFYLKKGINIGPLRINLSKSGVGLSVGGKGLRVGSGPQGAYVHAGRKGLYYRKNISNPSSKWGWILLIALIAIGIWAWQSGYFIINFDV